MTSRLYEGEDDLLAMRSLLMEARSRTGDWHYAHVGEFLFTFLIIAWAVVFGIGLQLVPHTGANSPYGGIGLIALFSGFFIMMGFLWSVIGE